MKLARYTTLPHHPWSPLESFFRQPFPLSSASWDALFQSGGAPSAAAVTGLAVDVYEDESHYYARFEVPGVKKEDAQVEFEDRRLAVTVIRKSASGPEATEVKLSRSLTVPEGIAVEGISAKLEDGLLTVTLPKQEQRKPRVISLN